MKKKLIYTIMMLIISCGAYSQTGNPVQFRDFKVTEWTTSVREVTGYINLDKPTQIKFNMSISGNIYEGQYATFHVANRSYSRNINLSSADETITLPAGTNMLRIRTYAPGSSMTVAWMRILEVNPGTIGYPTGMSTP